MEESLSLELPKRSHLRVWTETVLFAAVNVGAFFGNLTVCYTVYRNQRLHTLTNIFVVALAVSDIFMSICCNPFSVATLYRGRWIFGERFCQFHGFTLFMFSMTSLSTMGIIAVSRYFCVVKREKYLVLFKKQRILMYLAGAWFVAAVGCVPPLLFKTGGYKFKPAQASCMYPFEAYIGYTVLIELVYIATPLTLITFCYAKVFYTVSQSNRVFSPERNLHQLRANVEEVKVTKTLAVVMVGFAICWLPISIMDFIDCARGGRTLPREAYLTYGFLAYLSSTTNPFIYGAMNRHFRRGYKAVLWKTLCFERCQCAEGFSGSESRRSWRVRTSST